MLMEKHFEEELAKLKQLFFNEKTEEKSRLVQLAISYRIFYLEQQLVELKKLEIQNK